MFAYRWNRKCTLKPRKLHEIIKPMILHIDIEIKTESEICSNTSVWLVRSLGGPIPIEQKQTEFKVKSIIIISMSNYSTWLDSFDIKPVVHFWILIVLQERFWQFLNNNFSLLHNKESYMFRLSSVDRQQIVRHVLRQFVRHLSTWLVPKQLSNSIWKRNLSCSYSSTNKIQIVNSFFKLFSC